MWRTCTTRVTADKRGPSKAKPALPADVHARLLDEFPWLQESDVQRVLSRREASGSSHGSGDLAGPMVLSEQDLVAEAVAVVETELSAKRKEWRFDEDVETYFYLFVAGGNWTKKYKGCATDSVQYKARNNAKAFCELFGWPKMKTFTFNLYGEEASNQLAREWVRKSHHYMVAWLESGGTHTFEHPDSLNYECSAAFLDWACSLEDGKHPAFARSRELQDHKPRLLA